MLESDGRVALPQRQGLGQDLHELTHVAGPVEGQQGPRGVPAQTGQGLR